MQAFLEAAKKSGHHRTAGQIVFGGQPGAFVSNTFYDSWADLAKGRPPQRVMSPPELEAFNRLTTAAEITVISRDITAYDAEMSVAAPAASSR